MRFYSPRSWRPRRRLRCDVRLVGRPSLIGRQQRRRRDVRETLHGCRALDNEKTGPRLRGVFGRPAASVPLFPYSESLRKSTVTWDNNSLDKWLTDPDGFIPDNDMAYRVPSNEERAAIIEYLKDVSPK
jgi:cytochrome c2